MNLHRLYFVLLILCCSCTSKKQNTESLEKLGHYLFFDTRLSLNNTKSCASCHNPNFAFTDGYRTSITSLGENVLHNSPSLINVVELKRFDWANSHNTSLMQQIKRPLYSTNPTELGLDKHLKSLQQQFYKDSLYKNLFEKAFPKADSLFTKNQIEIAIIAYVKTLKSTNSSFDANTLTQAQQNGYNLFKSNKLNCNVCHTPPYFTLAALSKEIDSMYANNGLYNINNQNKYPLTDNGLIGTTKNVLDDGKYKIPSLRNVILTAPYMHDGSVASINEVIDIYARGGRLITKGAFKGDGKLNKNKHSLIKGFTLSDKEKKELIDFLTSLTDSSLFYNPQFKNPFN